MRLLNFFPLAKTSNLLPAMALAIFAPLACAQEFLSTHGHDIVDSKGNVVVLRGFNVGGWTIMENFMSPMDEGRNEEGTGPRNDDTWSVMRTLEDRFGEETMRHLMKVYEETWFNADDLDNIAAGGFNVIRVPLWWGHFFHLPADEHGNPTVADFLPSSFDLLDNLVTEAGKRGIYVIFDMHGAVGGQSNNGNNGKKQENRYWTDPQAQQMTNWLWTTIAEHYRGNPTVAGYDLLNEPDPRPSSKFPWLDGTREQVLDSYDTLYQAVRAADPEHIVYIEGTFDSWDWSTLPRPGTRGWKNVVYEFHSYPFPFSDTNTFFALAISAQNRIVAQDINNHLNYGVPSYVGEFNPRSLNKDVWRFIILEYDSQGASWSSWAYKSVNGIVGHDYWGWYSPTSWTDRPNISFDSAEAIEEKWSHWSTKERFAQNTNLGIVP